MNATGPGGITPEWILIGVIIFGALITLVVIAAVVIALGNRGAKDGLPEDKES